MKYGDKFPETMDEYWRLSKEEREYLWKTYGFGWRTILEGVWGKPGLEKPEQGELFDPDLWESAGNP